MVSAAFHTSVSGAVLVASPSSQLRDKVLSTLEPRGPVHVASGGAEALAKLENGHWQMLFLDRRLPDLDAEELVEIIERRYSGIRVVMVDSEVGDGEASARDAWSSKCAVSGSRLAEMTQDETDSETKKEPLPGMIGESASMCHLSQLVRLVAPRNTTVLIGGPTGSGKELVARAIHQLSRRSASPFSVVNCAAIPEPLFESELFGYARGAFTGAVQTYAGKILATQGGTLFLDEVGELPLGAQAKLLRFLEQKEVQRLGSTEVARVDVRVIAASHRDLAALVEKGAFRDDLYYRLTAFPIEVAPLAERTGDIPQLAAHFLDQLSPAGYRLRLDTGAERVLKTRNWPGNVRELQQVLERAAIFAGNRRLILAEDLGMAPARKVV